MDNSWILNSVKGVLTLFFLFASSIKILGWQKDIFLIQLEMFKKFGINRQQMLLIGLVEFTGVLLLWLPGYIGLAGAFLLLGTSVGAITFHLRFDAPKDALPATVMMILSTVVLYIAYKTLI